MMMMRIGIVLLGMSALVMCHFTRQTPFSANVDSIGVDPGSNEVFLLGDSWQEIDGKSPIGKNDVFLTRHSAQPPYNHTQSIVFGSDQFDDGRQVEWSSGWLYVVGSFGAPTSIAPAFGGEDIFFAKLNPRNLSFVYIQTYGGAADDEGQSFALDEANDVVFITGSVTGGFNGGVGAGNTDWVIIKANLTDGRMLQSTQLGSDSWDKALKCRYDANGQHLYVTGYFDGNLTVGVTQDVARGYDDFAVAKFTKDLTQVWIRLLSTDSTERGTTLEVFDDYLIVMGYTYGELTSQPHAGSSQDVVIAKFQKSNGNVMGVNQISMTEKGRAAIWASVVDPVTKRLFVSGKSKWNTPNYVEYYKYGDQFVGMVDVDSLEMTWGLSIGNGKSVTQADGMCIAPNGVVYTAGYTFGKFANQYQDADRVYFSGYVSRGVDGKQSKNRITEFPSENLMEMEDCVAGMYANDDTANCYLCPDGNATLVTGSSSCPLNYPAVQSVSPTTGPTTGNSIVQLSGVNFKADQLVMFNDTVAKSCVFISSRQMNCTSPEVDVPRNVSVRFASNHVNPLFVYPSFKFYAIDSVKPQGVQVGSGGPITIQGRGFSLENEGICHFVKGSKSWRFPIEHVSVQESTCATPADAGTYDLHYSLNMQELKEHVQPLVVWNTTIDRASPKSGLVGGGTVVEFTGIGLEDAGDSPVVKVGDLELVGNFSDGKIIALSPDSRALLPTMSPGSLVPLTVKVAPNGIQFLESVPFGIYTDHGLSNVYPNTVPSMSNQVNLTLTPDGGKGFANTLDEIRVRFLGNGNDVTIPATWESVSSITAAMPSLSGNGEVKVAVALNGQQFSAWKSISVFSVSGASPKWGATTGNTVVTVNGQSFVNTGKLSCRFNGGGVTRATFVSESQMTCITPNLPTGPLLVTVSTNEMYYSTNSVPQLTISPMPVLSTMEPSEIAARLSRSITVVGSGFVDTGEIRVQFTETVVPGTYVSSTSIRCTIPPLQSNTYNVRVSLNGGQQYSNEITLDVNGPTILGMSPTNGPISGGTNITLQGQNLYDSGYLRVHIGSMEASSVQWIDSQTIVAVTPGFSSAASNLNVKVSTNNGSNWVSSSASFEVYTPCQFSSVSPSGVITTGGTIVSLTGTCNTGFVKFNSGSAIPVSSGKFTLPSISWTDTQQIMFARNGQQYIPTGQSVTGYIPPSVTSSSPLRKDPGTQVTVTIVGAGFVDTGSVVVRMGQQFPATVITSTQITVVSPDSHRQGEYTVEISLDGGQHFSKTDGVVFSVLSVVTQCPENAETSDNGCVCKFGFYGPGSNCLPCPPNGFCLGKYHQPVPKPGFYNTGKLHFIACAVHAACQGGNSTCARGYAGNLCGSCQPGFFKLGDACHPCSSASPAAFLILLTLILTYAVWVSGIVEKSLNFSGDVIVIALINWQMLTLLGDFQLRWPDSVQELLTLFSIANLNIDLAAPECTNASWTFEESWWFTMSLPLILIGALCLRILLQYALAQWTQDRGQEVMPPNTWIPKWQFAWEISKYNWRVFVNQHRPVTKQTIRRLINEIMFTVFFLYIPLSSKVIKVFDCTDMGDGRLVMSAMPDEECWVGGGVHERLVIPGFIFLLFYVVGIPFTNAMILWIGKNVETRLQPNFQTSFSTVFNEFDDRYFWFQLVLFATKLMMVLIHVFIQRNPAAQGLMAISVLSVAVLLHIANKPFLNTHQNISQSFMSLSTLLVAMMGIVFVSNAFEATALTFVLILGSFVITVGLFVTQWLRNLERKQVRMQRCGNKEEQAKAVGSALKRIFKGNVMERAMKIVETDYNAEELVELEHSIHLGLSGWDDWENNSATVIVALQVLINQQNWGRTVGFVLNDMGGARVDGLEPFLEMTRGVVFTERDGTDDDGKREKQAQGKVGKEIEVGDGLRTPLLG